MFSRLTSKLLAYGILVAFLWSLYYSLWGKHVYLVTAYCGCPICINVPKYQKDTQFASGKHVYWGGAAADPKVPFGTQIELVALWPQDWFAISATLKGRRDFVVEDRGGKIKGRHIDLFIPDSLGGHQTALNWGVRRMRLRMNGKLLE